MFYYVDCYSIYFLFQPFISKRKPKASFVIFAILIVWILSLAIALLPLMPTKFQSVFVEKAFMYENPFFENAIVKFDSAKNWTRKLMTFDPDFANTSDQIFQRIEEANSWYSLQNIIETSTMSASYFQPAQFLG